MLWQHKQDCLISEVPWERRTLSFLQKPMGAGISGRFPKFFTNLMCRGQLILVTVPTCASITMINLPLRVYSAKPSQPRGSICYLFLFVFLFLSQQKVFCKLQKYQKFQHYEPLTLSFWMILAEYLSENHCSERYGALCASPFLNLLLPFSHP